MLRFTFVPGSPPDFLPLSLVAVALAVAPKTGFSFSEFAFAGTLRTADGLLVVAYRHATTEKYLTVDRSGHTFRFIRAIKISGEWLAEYEPYVDLLAAVFDCLLTSELI
jgi:hypothetical protein